MPDNERRYPTTIEGEALASLSIRADVFAAVRLVELVSETSLVIDLGGQTVAVDVQPPTDRMPSYTMKVALASVATGERVVLRDAVPLDGVSTILPNGQLITTAVLLAEECARSVHGRQTAADSFVAALTWIAPGGIPAPATKHALHTRQVLASRTREADGDVVVTLKIRYGLGGQGAPPASMFR
jgi:hypothetical protein